MQMHWEGTKKKQGPLALEPRKQEEIKAAISKESQQSSGIFNLFNKKENSLNYEEAGEKKALEVLELGSTAVILGVKDSETGNYEKVIRVDSNFPPNVPITQHLEHSYQSLESLQGSPYVIRASETTQVQDKNGNISFISGVEYLDSDKWANFDKNLEVSEARENTNMSKAELVQSLKTVQGLLTASQGIYQQGASLTNTKEFKVNTETDQAIYAHPGGLKKPVDSVTGAILGSVPLLNLNNEYQYANYLARADEQNLSPEDRNSKTAAIANAVRNQQQIPIFATMIGLEQSITGKWHYGNALKKPIPKAITKKDTLIQKSLSVNNTYNMSLEKYRKQFQQKYARDIDQNAHHENFKAILKKLPEKLVQNSQQNKELRNEIANLVNDLTSLKKTNPGMTEKEALKNPEGYQYRLRSEDDSKTDKEYNPRKEQTEEVKDPLKNV
ncbi:MAG: hypothetical protein MK033_01360 [Candidatus Caenarcaniphilales bacterium]|nr:hypothetical protein [Candidatus Caenarcaniphilales bacterium]